MTSHSRREKVSTDCFEVTLSVWMWMWVCQHSTRLQIDMQHCIVSLHVCVCFHITELLPCVKKPHLTVYAVLWSNTYMQLVYMIQTWYAVSSIVYDTAKMNNITYWHKDDWIILLSTHKVKQYCTWYTAD